MRTAAVLVAALFAAPAAAQDAVSLKWSLKEGDKFFAKSDTDMDMSMAVMGQNVDINMTVHSVQLFKVLSVKSNATTVEMTFQKMEMKSGGATPIPMIGAIGERIKGATITAVLDSDMKVTKLEGYKAFIDKLAGDDDMARKLMKVQMSEPVVSQMFSQVFSFGPDKPVKSGETWTRSEKMSVSGLDATVKQKYKLDSVANGIAKIGYTADVGFKPGGGLPGLPEGVKVDNFDMKAEKFTGTLQFDTKAGRLVGGTQDAAMTGSMSLGVAGQKLDVGMKIKMKSETSISDKNPVKD